MIATASPANHALVKNLGAEAVFDYKDPGVSSKIKQYTNGKLEYAVDCISEGSTPTQICGCLAEKGGKVAVILPVKGELPRSDVRFIHSLAYTLLGAPLVCLHFYFLNWVTFILSYRIGIKSLRFPSTQQRV